MIIYVSNLVTTRNSLTVPFVPTDDISDQVCRLQIEQFYTNTSGYDLEITCNLTQPQSLSYTNSTVATSRNSVVGSHSNTNSPSTNYRFTPYGVYVYIPPGPQDLTFSFKRSYQGKEDSPAILFSFLITITKAPPRIPSILYVKSDTTPVTILYEPPVDLAGKTVNMNLMWRSLFTPVRCMLLKVTEITQLQTNDNRVISVWNVNEAWENTPIKFYMPYGPFEMTFEVITANNDRRYTTAPPTALSATSTTINGWTFTTSSSKSGDTLSYNAFASTYWVSDSLYTTSTGAYTGTTSTNGVLGEWIQLQLPFAGLKYSSVSYYSPTLGTYVVMGSTNGTTWTQAIVGNTYTYFRMVFTSLVPVSGGSGTSAVSINNMYFIGAYSFQPRFLVSFSE